MIDNKLKIIYAGSSNISAILLEFLLNNFKYIKILSVLTNNLNIKKKFNPIQKICFKYNLICCNNVDFKNDNNISILKKINPNLIIVISYGKILPINILSIPNLGCINVHYSNLPRWSGSAPIQRSIIANDKITGVTIIKMNEKLDDGNIIFNKKIIIKKNDNAITLTHHLNKMAQKGLLIILNKFLYKEKIFTYQQQYSFFTYARKIDKEESKLKWWLPSFYLVRYIKALIPYPTTYFFYKNIRIKVWEANTVNKTIKNYIPGQIVCLDALGLKIATGCGVLNINKIQLPGKLPITITKLFNSSQKNLLFYPLSIIN